MADKRFSGWGIGSLLTFFTANIFVLIRIILDENLESSILPFNGILPGFILVGVGLFLAFSNDKHLAKKFEKLKKMGRLHKVLDRIGADNEKYLEFPDSCSSCGEKLNDEKIEWVGKKKVECQFCGAIMSAYDPQEE